MSAGLKRTLLCLPLLLLGAENLLHLLQVIVGRIGYSYELEWMEGAMLQQVLRLLHGEPLYGGEPSLDFIPALYMPLYYLCAALAVQFAGESFFALRLVSVLATLLTLLLAFLVVQRVTRSRLAGMLALCAYAGMYPHTAFWFDVGRLDALWTLMLALSLYALLRLRDSAGAGWLFCLALGSVLALFTKQASVFLLPFVGITVVCWCGWRLLWHYLLCCSLFALAGVALLQWSGGADWLFYTLQMAGSHGVTLFGARRFAEIVVAAVPASLLAVPLFLACVPASRRDRFGWLALIVGFITLSGISRAYTGAFFNVLMPLYFCLACCAALAVHGLLARAEHLRTTRSVVVVIALVSVLSVDGWRHRYAPERQWPESKSATNTAWLVQQLRALEGPVCVTSHGYLGWLAGKGFCAHNTQVTDLVTGSDPVRAERFRAAARARILNGYYAVIVLDREKELADLGLSLAEIPYTAQSIAYPDGEITFAVNGRSPRLWLQRRSLSD